MKITHYGHACVLLELDGARVLVDPGAYSTGFDELENLDLVLITHKHPDHVAADRLTALVERNPGVKIITNADVAAGLGEGDVIEVADGDSLNEAGVDIVVTGREHAVIYPQIPNVENTGFIVGGQVWHPGDSFAEADRRVRVLLVPIGGPWLKLAEAIDFVRAVAPDVAIPIHQGGLAQVHRDVHYGMLKNLAPEGTQVLVLDEGVATEV